MAGISALIENALITEPQNWLVRRWDFISTLSTLDWETVKDASAAAAVASDTAGGALLLTSQATTDDDGALVQSINEFWLPTAGYRAFLEGEMKGSTVAQQELFFGFAQTAATNPEACLTASNRAGFQVDDGNASILCKSEATDVETSVDSQVDLADDVYKKFSIYYDGAGTLEYYVADVKVASITTNVPATELGISMYSLSGNNTGTRVGTFRRVIVGVELV